MRRKGANPFTICQQLRIWPRELQADDLRYTRDTVLGITAENTGQPLAKIAEDSLRDRWYTAAESVDYGFIDRVVDGFDEMFPRAERPQTGLRASA